MAHTTRPSTSAASPPWALPVLVAALTTAGAIHFLLTPEHLEMSGVLGAGFLAAGIAQLAMAGMTIFRPTRPLFVAVIALSVALVGAYSYNVVVGLPFHAEAALLTESDDGHHDRDHDHTASTPDDHHAGAEVGDEHHSGVVVGAGEPVTAAGALTQLAQLVAAGVAAHVVLRSRRSEPL